MATELKELYQRTFLDHGRNPRNQGEVQRMTHSARGHNPLCGDVVNLSLHRQENGTINDIAFEGRGCAISIATASLMTEMVKGRHEDDARALGQTFDAVAKTGEGAIPDDLNDDDAEKLRILAGIHAFPMRIKCATLPWRTLEAALESQSTATTEPVDTKIEA